MNEHFTNSPLEVELEAGDHKWCACGKSASHPICDSLGHKGGDVKPVRYSLPEKSTVFLCRCGKSGTRPFCDGTHGRI